MPGWPRLSGLARRLAGRDAGCMTEIRPAAASEPAGSGGAVLETTVGGVLRAAAERAAGTIALVEGTADYRRRRRAGDGESGAARG
jgi:hypothetical protein